MGYPPRVAFTILKQARPSKSIPILYECAACADVVHARAGRDRVHGQIREEMGGAQDRQPTRLPLPARGASQVSGVHCGACALTLHGRLGSSRLRCARAHVRAGYRSLCIHVHACACSGMFYYYYWSRIWQWSPGLSLICLHAAVRAVRSVILPLHQCGLVPSLHSCNGFGLDCLGRTGSGGGRQDRSYPKGLGRHDDSRAATRSICARPDASTSRVQIDVMHVPVR
jgi:hypothetical protein